MPHFGVWVGVSFSVTRLDSFHKVEAAAGAVGSLGSVSFPQMVQTANVEPAVAAGSMLRPCSRLGFQAESLHGKDVH